MPWGTPQAEVDMAPSALTGGNLDDDLRYLTRVFGGLLKMAGQQPARRVMVEAWLTRKPLDLCWR